jgi:hypothetical protein
MTDSPDAPLEWRQRRVDHLEATQTHLDGRQAQIHTSMPGHIVSFDPKTMTATVQPALQGMYMQRDGTRKPVDISPIHDVPVHFPSGGGFTMTFPIKPNDECLVVFQERSIDNWHQHGGIQKPSDMRMHDINDCVVHVGVRSQPKVLANVHADNVQMRSDDGATFLEMSKGNVVHIVAPGGIIFDAPFLHVSGAVIAGFGGADQIGLQTHNHTQGADSRGDGEVPTNPPTPGT